MLTKVVSIARGRFYYGWKIVGVGFVGNFLLTGVQAYVFGVFFKPMSEELGWTRAMYSGVQSVSTAVHGLVAPFIGPIIDKRGARGLMIFGAVVGGAGFAALGLVRGLWGFYLIRGILTVGIACAGSLTINVVLCNWFVRKRGKAVAAGIMGSSFGGVVMTPVATHLILTYGWRMTWVFLGIAVWVVVIPAVAFFMKRRPEDIGLLPDGGQGSRVKGQGTEDGGEGSGFTSGSSIPGPLPLEVTWTRSEAMRTSTLWLTILIFGLGSMGPGVIGIHYFPFLTDIGLEVTAAGVVVSVLAVSIFVFRLSWGFLVDRYQVRSCGVIVFASCVLLMVLLVSLTRWPSIWLVYLSAVLIGFALGGQMPIQEVLWANYFGRHSLGAIRSVALPFTIGFTAASPLFAGWVYDRFGSYQVAYAAMAVTYTVATTLFYVTRPPKTGEKGEKGKWAKGREAEVSRRA